jgi:hypothetical protein
LVDDAVAVVVSVADDALGDLDDVVTRLRVAGLRVDRVLDTIGMVTGFVRADAVATLGSVPGVAGVEHQRTHRIPPPDSDVS